MQKYQSNNRNLGIDFLRGFSILFVILLHLNIHLNLKESVFNEIFSPKFFNIIFWSGYYGVVIFFTLSGYLITSTVLKRWNNLADINLKRYYWLRFSRIIPTLLVLLSILSLLHVFKVEAFVINEEKTSLSMALFAALTFHINWLEMKVGYLPGNWDVLWTISIEEVFYLIFPVLCVVVKKNWILFFILISILIISPISRVHIFSGNELGDRNNLNYLDCIALGVFTAQLTYKTEYKVIIKNIIGVLGILFTVTVIGFRGNLYKMGITGLGLDLTVLSTGISLLVFWMHYYFKTINKAIIPLNWLCSLGKYSYEIYLTHMFIVTLASFIFRKFNLTNSVKPIIVLISFALCYLLGRVIFEYFSDPINKNLRKKQTAGIY